MTFTFTDSTADATLFVPYMLYMATITIVYAVLQYGSFSVLKLDEDGYFGHKYTTGVRLLCTIAFISLSLGGYLSMRDTTTNELRFPQEIYVAIIISITGAVMIYNSVYQLWGQFEFQKDTNLYATKEITNKLKLAAYFMQPSIMFVTPLIMGSFVFFKNQEDTTLIASNTSVYLFLTSAILLSLQASNIFFVAERKDLTFVDKIADTFSINIVTRDNGAYEVSYVFGYCIFMLAGYLMLYLDQIQASIAFGVTIGFPVLMMYIGQDSKYFAPFHVAATFGFFCSVWTLAAVFDADDANANIMVLQPRYDNADNFLSTIKVLSVLSFAFNCASALYVWSCVSK